jgi:hypothetical protein
MLQTKFLSRYKNVKMLIFGEIWTDRLGGVTGSVVKYVT